MSCVCQLLNKRIYDDDDDVPESVTSLCVCVLLERRLKYLLHKAESEVVGREELLAHIGYVVNVLDSAYDDSRSVRFHAVTCCSPTYGLMRLTVNLPEANVGACALAMLSWQNMLCFMATASVCLYVCSSRMGTNVEDTDIRGNIITKVLRYGTHCKGITQFYLHATHLFTNEMKPYLSLPFQRKLVVIYRHGKNGRLSRRSARDRYVADIAVVNCSNRHASLGKWV